MSTVGQYAIDAQNAMAFVCPTCGVGRYVECRNSRMGGYRNPHSRRVGVARDHIESGLPLVVRIQFVKG